MTTVLISGSRSIRDYGLVVEAIKSAPFDIGDVIHGGAKGVDTCADAYCAVNSIPTRVIEPEYHLYDESAPLMRNKDMVQFSDAMIAVWDGNSGGTWQTFTYAKECYFKEVKRYKTDSGVKVIYLVQS